MTRTKAPLCLAAILAFTALPRGMAAEDPPSLEVSAEALDAARLEAGAKVKVTGKYRELIDKDLVLFDCRIPFVLTRPELLKKILESNAQRDNIIVVGTVVSKDDGFAVEVEDLARAPSDLEVLAGEVEALAKGSAEGKRGLPGLAKRVLVACERFGELDLAPLALRTFAESLGTEGEALAPAELEERLVLLRGIQRVLKDTGATLQAALALEKKCPDHPGVRALLSELGCRKYGGRWVTYEELKQREGFVEHRGRWVSPREKHLLTFVEAFRAQRQSNVILRRRTDREYQLLAEKGNLEEGMRPEEASLALGFPDRVERRILLGKELDQWSYGSKYCYFYGGVLVKKPDN